MASCIPNPGGVWLSLLLVLLFLLPGQHGKNKEAKTITTKTRITPPVTIPAFTDCCRDHGEVNESFVVELCPAAFDSNATHQRRWDERAPERDCINRTELCHEFQSIFPSFVNCTISMCTDPSPVKNLTLGTRTNSSITLHWQTTFDCCPMVSTSNPMTGANDIWRNCTAHITGLLPGQDYNITVYRIWDENCSQGTPISGTTMPSPVPEITIWNCTVDSLVIGWTPPGDPHTANYHYELCVSNCKAASYCYELCVSNYNTASYVVDSLEAGVTYKVVVYAITKNNISSTGTAINATTVPNSPRNMHVGKPSNNSVFISWNRPEDENAKQYRYCLSWFPENKTDLLKSNSTSGLNYTINMLQPGLLYSVNVASIIHDLKSKETTEWILTPPCPPTHFSIQTISQNEAVFTWVAPNSSFSGYELQWKSWTGSEENQTYRQDNCTEAVLNQLTPSTNYTFTLLSLAKGRNQMAYSSGVQLQRATKPEGVTGVECWALGGGHDLKLSWKCPTSEVSELLILVSNQTRKTLRTCQESTVIGHLQPAKRYQIQVRTDWYDQHVMSDLKECVTDSTGVIVGPLVAGLFLLLILSLLLLYFRRWRRKPSNDLKKPKPDVGLPETVASMPVSTFPCYCEERLSGSGLSLVKEYQQLQDVGTEQSQSVAERLENQAKNRYSNVLPYDHARVQLILKPGDPNSDYINASYMPGFKREKEFIAAQGPICETLYDFWRMIWDQRITTLVMLTNCVENGRVKCERYWPLDYTPCTYEDISVSVITETILPDWTIRDFSIKRVNESEVRLARHYHYTSWPDHGVPPSTSAILCFRDLMRGHIEEHEDSGPALVHCSAGVGRTGTLIALDSLLRQAQEEGQLSVFSFVQRLRMNRPLMIQTESQYIFLHQCLLDRIKPAMKHGTEKMEYTVVYENALALQEYEISRV